MAGRQVSADSFDMDDCWAFRTKVYPILLVQLIIILAVVLLLTLTAPAHNYVVTHEEVFWVLLIGLAFYMVCMFCCIDLTRLYPASHILFFVLTLGLCLFIAVCACYTDVISIALAIFIAIVVVACLSIFAVQTIIDYTVGGGILIVSIVLLFTCMIISIVRPSSVYLMIACYIGGIILGLYLLYDVELMLNCEHKYAFAKDEYVFAVLMFYLDIFNIGSFILSCCGLTGND